MSWSKSGDERAKSYQVYKDLERQYRELQRAYDELGARLAAKDESLRQLSKELYQALEGSMTHEASNRPGLAKTSVTVTPDVSVPMPQPHQSTVVVRADIPMRELLEQPPKRKEG